MQNFFENDVHFYQDIWYTFTLNMQGIVTL